MKSFKKFYLTEARDNLAKDIITHLEHVEDLLLLRGEDGLRLFDKAVREVLDIDLLKSGKIKLSSKIDGSPALYFGVDPEDGKFFVSTKSVNNREPKLVKSQEDVNLFDSLGLREKLSEAYEQLSKLEVEPNIVYQGDVLFTGPDKRRETIDGVDYITFTPNTLTYAIQVSYDSPVYRNVKDAVFGIVVHTKYNSKKTDGRFIMSQATPDFDDLIDQGRNIPGLFIEEPMVKGQALDNIQFHNEEQILIDLEDLKQTARFLTKDLFPAMTGITDFLPRLRVFVNSELEQPGGGIFGQAASGEELNWNKFKSRMKAAFEIWWDKQIVDALLKLKTDVGRTRSRTRKAEEKDRWTRFVDDHDDELLSFFKLYYLMTKIKFALVDDLEDMEGALLKTFVKDGGGYRVTGGEGHVLIGSENTLKLVNRLEFSALNRLMSQNRYAK